jgi:urease accessory protein
VALAHTGVGAVHGFGHGFAHPISGLDHVLAMVAVGVFAAQLGGAAIWRVPLAFVGAMAVGGALGVAGVQVPFLEIGIALSVVALGLLIASGAKPPIAVAMVAVGFFALFHGHAHGAEMPATASGLTYGAGFIAATALLHAAGVGLEIAATRIAGLRGGLAVRLSGGAAALVGVVLLAGVF